jgi:hypothetical protein
MIKRSVVRQGELKISKGGASFAHPERRKAPSKSLKRVRCSLNRVRRNPPQPPELEDARKRLAGTKGSDILAK